MLAFHCKGCTKKHATCVERRKMKKGGCVCVCVCEGGGVGLLESFRFEDENEFEDET